MSDLTRPTAFIRTLLSSELPAAYQLESSVFDDYESWWREVGAEQAEGMNPPQLSADGSVSYAPNYELLYRAGLRTGLVWRAFVEETPLPSFLLGYTAAYFDPGLFSVYAATLTAHNLIDKYAREPERDRINALLTAQDDSAWRGAVWLGVPDSVDVSAHPTEDGWVLIGEREQCANVTAEVALVAARPEGQPNAALFMVPRQRDSGDPNFAVTALDLNAAVTALLPVGTVEFDESQAFLLGELDEGAELIREARNVVRLSESLSSVALAQRVLRHVADNPAISAERLGGFVELLRRTFALVWAGVDLCNWTWREIPLAYSETYRIYWLTTHLAARAAMTLLFALTQNRDLYALNDGSVVPGLGRLLPLISRSHHWYQRWDASELNEALSLLVDLRKPLFDWLQPYTDADSINPTRTRAEALMNLMLAENTLAAQAILQETSQIAGITFLKKLRDNASTDGETGI